MTHSRVRAEFPAGVALVVGGSGGVGAAVSRRLATAGADVAITYLSNAADAERTSAVVAVTGRSASIHRLDVGDAAACTTLLGELSARYGRVHGVVHAAGSRIT